MSQIVFDKSNPFWGTSMYCDVCERCLCLTCHPNGACKRIKETDCSIPEDILEASKSQFLLWCDGCHQAFEPKHGAYGLPYNGIQHFICKSCQKKLRAIQ